MLKLKNSFYGFFFCSIFFSCWFCRSAMACLRAIAPVRSSLSRPESKIHWIAAVALLISRKIVVACHLPGGWWLGLGSRLGLWPGMAVKGWGLQLKRATAAFTAVLHLFQFAVCVCAARPFLLLCHNSFVLTACRTFLSLEICLPHEAPAPDAGFPAFPWFFLLLHCPLKWVWVVVIAAEWSPREIEKFLTWSILSSSSFSAGK